MFCFQEMRDGEVVHHNRFSYLSLVVGFIALLPAGTLYDFSLFGPMLHKTFELSASRLNLLSGFGKEARVFSCLSFLVSLKRGVWNGVCFVFGRSVERSVWSRAAPQYECGANVSGMWKERERERDLLFFFSFFSFCFRAIC
jgi:hypothetical protein